MAPDFTILYLQYCVKDIRLHTVHRSRPTHVVNGPAFLVKSEPAHELIQWGCCRMKHLLLYGYPSQIPLFRELCHISPPVALSWLCPTPNPLLLFKTLDPPQARTIFCSVFCALCMHGNFDEQQDTSRPTAGGRWRRQRKTELDEDKWFVADVPLGATRHESEEVRARVAYHRF